MTSEEYVVDAPDIAGRVTVLPPTLFGSARLRVDGTPARSGPRRNTFLLAGADGRDREAGWASSFLTVVPALVIEGRKHDVGPKIPIWLLGIAALPMGLVTIGGLIGGLFGGLAFGLNQQVARTSLPRPIQALVMLGVGAGAGIAFVVLATALQLAFGR